MTSISWQSLYVRNQLQLLKVVLMGLRHPLHHIDVFQQTLDMGFDDGEL